MKVTICYGWALVCAGRQNSYNLRMNLPQMALLLEETEDSSAEDSFGISICYQLLVSDASFSTGSVCGRRNCAAAMDLYVYRSLVCRDHLLSRCNLVQDLMLKALVYPVIDTALTCLGLPSG